MKISGLIRGLMLLCLVGAIVGCATTAENIRTTGEWEQARTSESTSVVFGRIQWLEKGVEKKIGSSMFEFHVRPGLLQIEDKTRHFGEVDENGEFVWVLEPGMYVIFRINYRDPWSGNYFLVPKVAFQVPEKGKVYYVGTLKVDFAPKRDFIGGLSGVAKITIEDKGERSYAVITENLNVTQGDIEKSLMIHDQRLPTTIDTTPEFQLTIQILNTLF